jgi:hypothetical protein
MSSKREGQRTRSARWDCLQSSARGCLSVGPRRGAANEPSLREELRCAPTERLKGGGTAACAPPPRPSRYSAVRVPPQPNVEGSRRQVGYGSGISPRCLAAACGSRDKAPTTTTAIRDTSFQCRTQIVSTKTYVHHSRLLHRLHPPWRDPECIPTVTTALWGCLIARNAYAYS